MISFKYKNKKGENNYGFSRKRLSKADLGAVINEYPDKRLTAVRKIMLGSHVLNPLLDEAQKFCFKFDTAVDEGYNHESLEAVVKEGVNNMFKVALKATKNLKFTDVKDRITIAQKLTDIMVNSATPVAFSFNDYTEYGQGFTVLKDSEVIHSAMEDVDKAVVNEAIADLFLRNKRQTRWSLSRRNGRLFIKK